jgi:hypothetical protein
MKLNITRRQAALGGGAALALFLLFRSSSISGKNDIDRWGNTIYRDTTSLVPAFASRVKVLFNRMRARGYDPMLWEAYRTPERAIKLAEDGKGIQNSMHIYGAAVDIIDAKKKWSDPMFFKVLGEEAERLGLYWGGRFSDYDGPHIQAIPIAAQQRFTHMTPSDREVFVQGLYV